MSTLRPPPLDPLTINFQLPVDQNHAFDQQLHQCRESGIKPSHKTERIQQYVILPLGLKPKLTAAHGAGGGEGRGGKLHVSSTTGRHDTRALSSKIIRLCHTPESPPLLQCGIICRARDVQITAVPHILLFMTSEPYAHKICMRIHGTNLLADDVVDLRQDALEGQLNIGGLQS